MGRDIVVDENVLLEHPRRMEKIYETVSNDVSKAFSDCNKLANRVSENKMMCQRRLMEIKAEMNNRTPVAEASKEAHIRLERFQELARECKALEARLTTLQQCERRLKEVDDQGRVIKGEMKEFSEKKDKLSGAYNSIIRRFLDLINRR